MQSRKMLAIAKVVLSIMLLAFAACFFVESDSLLVQAGRLAFLLTIGVHLIECAIFFPTVRASGKDPIPELVQILIYGVIHHASLKLDMEETQATE